MHLYVVLITGGKKSALAAPLSYLITTVFLCFAQTEACILLQEILIHRAHDMRSTPASCINDLDIYCLNTFRECLNTPGSTAHLPQPPCQLELSWGLPPPMWGMPPLRWMLLLVVAEAFWDQDA